LHLQGTQSDSLIDSEKGTMVVTKLEKRGETLISAKMDIVVVLLQKALTFLFRVRKIWIC
jgi:hypothetical protein